MKDSSTWKVIHLDQCENTSIISVETSNSVKSDFLCFSPVGSLMSDNGSHCSVSLQQEHSSGPLQQAAYLHSVKLCVPVSLEHQVTSEVQSKMASRFRICQKSEGNMQEEGWSVHPLHIFRIQLKLHNFFFSTSLQAQM